MSREEANRIVRAVERARRSRRAAVKVAIPTAAALGAGAAIAIGSIPSGDGTITGCYVTTGAVGVAGPSGRYGELRVIDPGATNPTGLLGAGSCLSDEATITWNQRGPQGVQGPAGAQGPAGRDLIGSTSFGFGGGGSTFLKLDGVKGEVTDKFHKEDIAISSFSVGATQHASGGGGGAGKVSFSSFTITKHIDKSSPALFRAAATGQHYKEATVFFAKAKRGKVADYLEYKMTNVFVSSIQDGTSSGGGHQPVEQISFSFAKIEEIFLGSNGKPTQSISINVLQNKLS